MELEFIVIRLTFIQLAQVCNISYGILFSSVLDYQRSQYRTILLFISTKNPNCTFHDLFITDSGLKKYYVRFFLDNMMICKSCVLFDMCLVYFAICSVRHSNEVWKTEFSPILKSYNDECT